MLLSSNFESLPLRLNPKMKMPGNFPQDTYWKLKQIQDLRFKIVLLSIVIVFTILASDPLVGLTDYANI